MSEQEDKTVKNIMGIIYTADRENQLKELTAERAVAAVPICGRYRMIDFVLSAMVDSGIRNVGVITQKKYNSLMDHLGSGREWDLHGKRAGLVFLPPFTQSNNSVYTGLLDALHANLHYLRRSKERYTVCTDAHMLFSAQFDAMVAQHEQSGADITLMYTRDPSTRRNSYGRYIRVEEDGRVSALESDPAVPHMPCTYLEAFCIRREMLITLVDEAVSQGYHHLTRDVLMEAISKQTMKVYGFDNPGRAWPMDSVQSYFNCSMELLNKETRDGLFPVDRPVLTKLRDEMPTHHCPGSKVKNALIADGCIIEGTVENSILFRGVHIAKGAVVRNCIIMQDGQVLEDAELEYCIMDKQSTVRPKGRLLATQNYPIVVAKDYTV